MNNFLLDNYRLMYHFQRVYKVIIMRNYFLPGVFFIALFSSGCSLKHPQSAEEFRIAAPGAFLAKKESYVVKRPFSKVASAFKNRHPNVWMYASQQNHVATRVISL